MADSWEELLDLPALTTRPGLGVNGRAGERHASHLRSVVLSGLDPERMLLRVRDYLGVIDEEAERSYRLPVESALDLVRSPCIVPPDPVLMLDEHDPWLWAGCFATVVGKAKAFKSIALQHLSLVLCEGEGAWMGMRVACAPQRILILSGEGDRAETKLRIDRQRLGFSEAALSRLMVHHVWDPSDGEDVELPRVVEVLHALAPKVRQYGLNGVIFDPYVVFSEGDENSNTDQRILARECLRFCKAHNVWLILVHHVRKLQDREDLDFEDARGAQVLQDLSQSQALFWRRRLDPDVEGHFRARTRRGPAIDPHLCYLDPETYHVTIGPAHGERSDEAGEEGGPGATDEELLDALARFGPTMTAKGLQAAAGVSRRTVDRGLKRLLASSLVARDRPTDRPRGAYRWSLTSTGRAAVTEEAGEDDRPAERPSGALPGMGGDAME